MVHTGRFSHVGPRAVRALQTEKPRDREYWGRWETREAVSVE